MSDILKLNKISAHDDARTLLKDISLTLGENETIAFIGESGSGKTDDNPGGCKHSRIRNPRQF